MLLKLKYQDKCNGEPYLRLLVSNRNSNFLTLVIMLHLINNNGSLSFFVHLTSLSITSYWSIYVGKNGKNEIHFND